jgi:hypothetical protein
VSDSHDEKSRKKSRSGELGAGRRGAAVRGHGEINQKTGRAVIRSRTAQQSGPDPATDA